MNISLKARRQTLYCFSSWLASVAPQPPEILP